MLVARSEVSHLKINFEESSAGRAGATKSSSAHGCAGSATYLGPLSITEIGSTEIGTDNSGVGEVATGACRGAKSQT